MLTNLHRGGDTGSGGGSTGPGGGDTGSGDGSTGPGGGDTGSGEQGVLTNPLAGAGIDNIGQLFEFIVTLLLAFVGIVAIISIMLAGYKLIISAADADGRTEAKNRILWSLTGLIVVLLAYAIVKLTIGLLQGR